MGVNRAQILEALTARLATAAGVATASRTFRAIDEVGASEQPAVFPVYDGEQVEWQAHEPAKHTLNVSLALYASPAELLPALDGITAALALAPDENGTGGTTLGGLAENVQITSIEADEGFSMENQAGARLALRVTVIGE